MSRLKTAEKAQTTYQGSAQSLGFNPQQAASEEAKTVQLKRAVVADGETKSREIQRVQQAENTVLQAQQEVERTGQRKDASAESAILRGNQAIEAGNLKDNQLFDRDILKQQQTYEKSSLDLKASHLKFSGQADSARTALVGKTVGQLLSFANSAISYDQNMQGIAKQEEADRRAEDEVTFANSALFGPNPEWGGEVSPEVEASSNASNAAYTADAQALGKAADEIESGGTTEDSFVAEQVRSETAFNQTAGGRAGVYAARSQWPSIVEDARANGLIRPGAEGLQDIQRLAFKHAKASGLFNEDPKLVAEIFTKPALAYADNTRNAINAEAAREVKAAREGAINSNITTLTSGITTRSTAADVGDGWDAANTENVNGIFFGQRSAASSRNTTVKYAKALADAGQTAALIKLKDHIPNPNTPNLTIGSEHGDILKAEILRSRQVSRTEYNLGKGELNREAESLLNDYWSGDPSPEGLRRTEAALRAIPTAEARRAADSLVQEGYNYDPGTARDIASRRGTESEASQAEIKDAISKGLLTPSEGKEALKYAPDAQLQTKIDEAVKLYAPEKGMTSSITAEGGRSVEYKRASPAFKAELRQKEARFKIELGRRLQSVLRDNRDLDPKSQEFQDLVEKETSYLMQQERFQISYSADKGGFKFGSDDMDSNLPDRITLSPGVQDVTDLTATEVFQTLKLNKGLFDPSVDNIISRENLEAESLAIVDGGKPSKRTNDWAAALGMSSKDLINGQRLKYGLPPLDRLMKDTPSAPMVEGNKTAGMNALRDLDFPTRGAAYMSSAIQHESAWAAQRPSWDLGAVDDAGRNGGLLSWNNGRLKNLESRYGRPVEQITQAEQLQFLKDELRTSYKDSYDIFMDPNASSGDLEWATWNYIRWNKKYTGTRWSTAENLIRWGNRNP